MEICVFSIQKSKSDNFENEIKQYCKMASKFANINDKIIFNDKIAKAQSSCKYDALISYDEVYKSNLKGFCVALDEKGKELNSYELANILENKTQISFFIGGAYGLSESKMTMAHKIAKLMLFEQIFRALCINANHPYHK